MLVKTQPLYDFFKANPRVALAFSGGVDSAYLLYAAVQCGCDARPYYVHTQFQPAFEFNDAKRLAKGLNVELSIITKDILSIDKVRLNPADRCYWCKHALFTTLMDAASKDGYTLVVDGTNASDEVSDRPGMRALRELAVLSPLREAGLTKAVIRDLSHRAGLFTWDKPAYACLATRMPQGVVIDNLTLQKIEHAEDNLRAMGFSDLRVRVYGKAARLQFPQAQLTQVLTHRTQILNALSPDFEAVLLDLNTR